MGDKVNLELTEQESTGVVVFKTNSLSNLDEIKSIADKVYDFVTGNKLKKVIIDFSEVQFFSSQVLGMLLNVRTKLQPFKGEVIISAINPRLYRVFRITNLDKIFRFFPDRQAALDAVSSCNQKK